MAGYLPPGCTQKDCDMAQPGYWDEPEEDGPDEPCYCAECGNPVSDDGWAIGDDDCCFFCSPG